MRDYLKRPAVFIATLGNAPQVVTLALDHLLPTYNFVEVCVIHTDSTPGPQQPQMKFGTMHETVVALDAKINFDDNALYRQKEIEGYRDLSEEEALGRGIQIQSQLHQT